MEFSPILFALSIVVILLAVPVALALRAFGAPARVVQQTIPAGVVTGGVLLVAGMMADSWGWVLAFVLGVAGIELATLALWAVVALLGRLRTWALRRQRS
ncbi:hypothetical protein [Flindersiella endophytica]